jgi:hypothetical protein
MSHEHDHFKMISTMHVRTALASMVQVDLAPQSVCRGAGDLGSPDGCKGGSGSRCKAWNSLRGSMGSKVPLLMC